VVVEGLPQYDPFHPTLPHLRQANSPQNAGFLQKTYSQKMAAIVATSSIIAINSG
jgi:hypothetical protein